MLKTRVIPCLLLKNAALVKTVQFQHPSYIGDPINAIRIYNEREADELIFLDITATLENKPPPFQVLQHIASECFMPVTYGGAVQRIEDIKHILYLGIEKVAINSYAIENPAFIREAAEVFGSQAIVVSIDAKKTKAGRYEVFTHGGHRPTNLTPVDWARRVEDLGAGEILITSIDRDGTQQGYDLELIKMVTSAVRVPVIACGGAGKVADFALAAKQGGASAVAAGSMVVYFGRNRAVLINFPSYKELRQVLD